MGKKRSRRRGVHKPYGTGNGQESQRLCGGTLEQSGPGIQTGHLERGMIGNIPSLGLLVFGISLTIACMACVGEQSPVAPNTGVPEEVRSQQEITRVPTPTPIITQLSTQQSTKSDLALKLADIPHNLPAYDRGDWKHWFDMDKDCQNTRHEVLIDESLTEVIFKDDRECQVAVGTWRDPLHW